MILHGPGLTFIEATAVSPEGRATVHDCGLWSDEQVGPLRGLVEFAHSQGQKIGIQLAHAGRKGSLSPLWLAGRGLVPKAAGGHAEDLVAPSAIPYVEEEKPAKWNVESKENGSAAPNGYSVAIPPKELSKEEIKEIVAKWAAAAKRAVDAGIDAIEIHSAHGFLVHEFLSPVTNKRTDEYGGSWENRARLVVEVVDAVRAAIPEDMPLFLR